MRVLSNKINKSEAQLKKYIEVYEKGLSFSEQYIFAKDGRVLFM